MKLLVIDGNSIVNRAYYGMHPLNNQEGFPTHAIYGFLNILRRIREEVDPDGVCVAFDRREPTFRHLADPDYKAQRKGMPEELAMQLPVLKQVLSAMNIPLLRAGGLRGRRPHRHHQPQMRGGGLGLRHRHRRQGQPPAHHRPHQGEAGVHPHGPDHHQGHDAGDISGDLRLRAHPYDRPEGSDGR